MIAGRRYQGRAPSLKEEQVGENADQPEQRQRDEGADEADQDGESGDGQDSGVHGEIAQLIFNVLMLRRFAFCGHPYLSCGLSNLRIHMEPVQQGTQRVDQNRTGRA